MSHIVNGNDIKLLALPVNEDKSTEYEQEKAVTELRVLSTNIHNELKKLPEHELVKLIEHYEKGDNENNEQ